MHACSSCQASRARRGMMERPAYTVSDSQPSSRPRSCPCAVEERKDRQSSFYVQGGTKTVHGCSASKRCIGGGGHRAHVRLRTGTIQHRWTQVRCAPGTGTRTSTYAPGTGTITTSGRSWHTIVHLYEVLLSACKADMIHEGLGNFCTVCLGQRPTVRM